MNLLSRFFRRPADPITAPMPLLQRPPAVPPPPRDELAHLEKMEQILAGRCNLPGGGWRDEMRQVLGRVRVRIGEIRAERRSPRR